MIAGVESWEWAMTSVSSWGRTLRCAQGDNGVVIPWGLLRWTSSGRPDKGIPSVALVVPWGFPRWTSSGRPDKGIPSVALVILRAKPEGSSRWRRPFCTEARDRKRRERSFATFRMTAKNGFRRSFPESGVPSPESRVPSPESRVPSPESRVPSPESRVPSPESRVPSTEYRVPSTEYRVPSPEYRQSGL